MRRLRRSARTRRTWRSSPSGRRARGTDPGELRYRDLRGFAAQLSGRGLAKSSVGRKLAAVRTLSRLSRRRGPRRLESRRAPADAEARAAPAADAGPRRRRRAPRPDPGQDAARGARPRDVRARLLVRPPSRGDRESRHWSRSTSTRSSCAWSARARRRAWCPSGEPAQRSLRRYLETARHALTGGPPHRRAVPLAQRPTALDLGRPPAASALGAGALEARPRLASFASPFVCDPPPGGRGGPAIDPGAARPFDRFDDPDLHARRATDLASRPTRKPIRAPERVGLGIQRRLYGDQRQGSRTSRAVAELQGRRR